MCIDLCSDSDSEELPSVPGNGGARGTFDGPRHPQPVELQWCAFSLGLDLALWSLSTPASSNGSPAYVSCRAVGYLIDAEEAVQSTFGQGTKVV